MKKIVSLALLAILMMSMSMAAFASSSETTFNKANFKGTTTTYTDSKTYITDDQNDKLPENDISLRTVWATTKRNTMLYYDLRRNQPRFTILMGESVYVLATYPYFLLQCTT